MLIFSLSSVVVELLAFYFYFLHYKILQNISGTHATIRAHCYKTFYIRNLRIFVSVCTLQAFQASLVFLRKAGAYPREASFRISNLGMAPGLTYKH